MNDRHIVLADIQLQDDSQYTMPAPAHIMPAPPGRLMSRRQTFMQQRHLAPLPPTCSATGRLTGQDMPMFAASTSTSHEAAALTSAPYSTSPPFPALPVWGPAAVSTSGQGFDHTAAAGSKPFVSMQAVADGSDACMSSKPSRYA